MLYLADSVQTQSFTLILSAISASAAIAAFLSCYLMYKTTRPNIKIKIDDSINDIFEPQCCFDTHGDVSVAVISASIVNNSSVAGFVEDLFLLVKGKRYYPESALKEEKTVAVLEVVDGNKTPYKIEHYKFLTPIQVFAFGSAVGCFFFQHFVPAKSVEVVEAFFCYKPVGAIRYRKQKIVIRRKKAVLDLLSSPNVVQKP